MKQLEKDLAELAAAFPFESELKNRTIMITGGTGLIGTALLRFLCYLNERRQLNLKILAVARNQAKATALNLPVEWLIQDMKEPMVYPAAVDYLIHAASPTQSAYFVAQPVETITDTLQGALNVLEFARHHQVQSLVYLSSLEVYGQNFDDRPIPETHCGTVDALSPRSCYPEGKRLIECLCASYAQEYGLNCKIARLTQTFGAGMLPEDKRICAQYARSALHQQNIVLHTAGNSARSYLYLTDAVSGIWYILFRGAKGEAYNLANDQTYISAKKMAELVKKHFNPQLPIKLELRDDMGYAPETKINLDVTKLKNLGWQPQVDLVTMYARTINFLQGG